MTDAVPFYSGIDDAEIGGRGIRWQDRPRRALPRTEASGGRRTLSAERRVARNSSATQLAAVASTAPPARPSRSGTYRDLWTGPITELNPPLRFLAPQQRVEMSIADAERLGLKTGDEVQVPRTAPACGPRSTIKERVAEGVCFLIEGTAEGNANALLNGAPVSVRSRSRRA